MTKPSNPKRTGGPRSQVGKLVAASNSLKTGVFSRQVVLPNEDRAEFELLQQHFFEDFRPHGILEEAMVHELSTIVWKKLRLDQIEHDRFEALMNQPVTPEELQSVKFEVPPRVDWLLKDLQTYQSLDINTYLEHHEYLLELKERQPRFQDIERLSKDFTNAYEALVELMHDHGLGDLTPEDIFRDEATANQWQHTTLLKYVLHDEITYTICMLGAIERRKGLDDAIRCIKTNRMLQVVQRTDLINARNHLDGRFYKIVTELRKQKDWYRKNEVIDVTPEVIGNKLT